MLTEESMKSKCRLNPKSSRPFSLGGDAERKYPELALMFHIPNEGKRSWMTGGRMKAEGLKSGVPDIFLPVPRGEFHGLFVEMKRTKGGTVSDCQKLWLHDLQKQGYCAAVCRGWYEAAECIKNTWREKRE